MICVVLCLKNSLHFSGNNYINEHFPHLVLLENKPRALCMLSMESIPPKPDSLTLVLNLSAWYLRKLDRKLMVF